MEAQGVGSANAREKKFVRQDTYSAANNILKIAKKRALVDAVLSATRSSGVFSQDLEDLTKADDKRYKINQDTGSKPSQNTQGSSKATDDQFKHIYAVARELELSAEEAK